MVNLLVVFFIIPVIIDIHRHRFEIYAPVLEIHENVDLVLGIKHVFKLEGNYKLMRLLFQIFEQIPTHFALGMCHT